MKVVLRRNANHLSFRRRHISLSSIEQVGLKRLKKIILALFCKIDITEDSQEKQDLNFMLEAVILKYLSLKVANDDDMAKCERHNRTIESFSPCDCKIFFEFKKTDLSRLFALLRFQDICKFDNKSVMSGEEVFLRGLYELVSGETKHNVSRNVFGRDWSAQSRAFKYFINHMFDNFQHLVTNNLHWWYRNGFFASSADAIGRKMGLDEEDKNMIAHFIDCNCLETCRVGGGPAEDGCNSARWDPLVQRTYYNG